MENDWTSNFGLKNAVVVEQTGQIGWKKDDMTGGKDISNGGINYFEQGKEEGRK